MEKIFKNKYLLMTLILVAGIALGWFIKPSGSNTEMTHQHDETTEYTCSMHPQIRQNEPGNCPICGMALVPVGESGGLDPDAVSMTESAMKLANIRTLKLESGGLTKTVRLTGKVEVDERKVFTQAAHIPGRIEDLAVNFTGEYVSRGSTTATLYSPELVTAQSELLQAYSAREKQPEIYQAARAKLQKWKLSDSTIDQIIANGEEVEQFPVAAETSGYIQKKIVNEGDYVKNGSPLYEIANLYSVWVILEVYENDLGWLKKGDKIDFTAQAIPGKTFSGVISFIDPTVNPKTRITRARLEVNNEDQLLKPGMFVTGSLETNVLGASQLIVPKSAVMWTGKRSVVYVKNESDSEISFSLREVILGPNLGDAYVVEEGLQPDEEIAISGTFSIDAAAQLEGKPSMMSPDMNMDEMESEISLPEINIHEGTLDVGDVFKRQIQDIFENYIPLKDAFIASDPAAVSSSLPAFANSVKSVDMSLAHGEAHHQWMKDLVVLEASIALLREHDEIEKLRAVFSPLSDQLYHTIKKFDVQTNGYRQFCPMAFDFEGAFWLSDSEEILNPYFGNEMLTCGNVEEELN